MTVPHTVGGVVCDVAALVAVVAELVDRRDGPGSDLYHRARTEGLTLAVMPPVLGRAALYVDDRGRQLLGAFLAPHIYRPADDPLRATGERGVWRLVGRHPDAMPEYSAMLGACGDPVVASVAAYAAASGWPVATDKASVPTYAELLGRNDAIVMPALPS